MMRTLSTLAILGAITVAANAYVVSRPGPYDSAGPIGDAGNGVFTDTYAGPSGLFGSLRIQGNLTEVNTGTYASEARWNIRNSSFAGGGVNFQSTATGNYTGTLPIDAMFTGLLAWGNAGDTFRFESFESFNDSGVDSRWTDLTFTFGAFATILDFGSYGAGTSFTMDTETSNFDTEIALYTAGGLRLANDDDGGSGTLSMIAPGVLAVGTYYLIGSGYDSFFADGFAGAGTATGALNMQINGVNKFSGALASRELVVGKFEVVPEPATLSVLAIGALALMRRRNRR